MLWAIVAGARWLPKLTWPSLGRALCIAIPSWAGATVGLVSVAERFEQPLTVLGDLLSLPSLLALALVLPAVTLFEARVLNGGLGGVLRDVLRPIRRCRSAWRAGRIGIGKRTLSGTLVLVVVAAWSVEIQDRRDAALYAELSAAPFSRFDESFTSGRSCNGRIRILPLEERAANQAALAFLARNLDKTSALRQYLREPGDDAEAALCEAMLDTFAASRTTLIDRRDEISARRIVATTRRLESEFGAGEVDVIVFVGAAHLTGVAHRVRQALGIAADAQSVDMDDLRRQALEEFDQESETSLSVQVRDFMNECLPDVDIGPVRLRGNFHSRLLGVYRHLEPALVAGLALYSDSEPPRSVDPYESVVDEVRELVIAGRQVVFFAEYDASTLVKQLSDVMSGQRFEVFKQHLAAHPRMEGEAPTGPALEAEAVRLFPFVHDGPSSLLFAKLDQATVPQPYWRAIKD